ncbi:diguanylate cyclase domain-containing protein [Dethiobacter alkaliphilus]|uniref:Diguanylate cyclase and metal dependent phosphohydrolase n=1 Tax=Dethiobacter alkaliphilus AHT 1 TaxID=555088 RepID=C0GHW2_DETAL|nr:diguanylate cyclase [Dethiobacter alkaliphilus]EEG77036.1 diguanylate cyclase and metal dependent phosphohydrolase [Dethiobacter alkaliphilus AHT 1]
MKKRINPYALRITAYYVLIAGLWIFFSDRLLALMVVDPDLQNDLQTYKGLFFVSLTGLLLFWELSRSLNIRLHNEQQLLSSNNKLSALIEASPLAIITLDKDGRVMSWNPAAETMFGWKEHEVLGHLNPIVPEDKVLEFRQLQAQVKKGGSVSGAEVRRQRKDGSLCEVSLSTAAVHNEQGEVTGFVSFIADITEQKQKEEQLRFLSLHDALTGIYNRTYFEQEMRRLESGRFPRVGMIVCDLDGLKLYNDSLGHDVGDSLLQAAAQIIKSCFRESDVVARIGGDEFAVLLPDTDLNAVENACERIGKGIARYNEENGKLYLSMSIGFAVSEEPVKIAELFKEADNNMYAEKLRRNENVRNATTHILLKALTTRDFIGDGHGERMEDMVTDFAQSVKIPESRLDDIRMFARYHDIGKVGISESLLMKPEILGGGELEEVRRHSEIGHRIALSAPDIAHLAEWILKHHEWWDGSGYPLGLKGKDIPLECRLLAIVDAYDALTSKRPYRQPLSSEEAFRELRDFAGRQFDPKLVEAFIEMMQARDCKKVPIEI